MVCEVPAPHFLKISSFKAGQPPLKTMPWECRKNLCTEESTTQPSDAIDLYIYIYRVLALVNGVSTGQYIESSSLVCFVCFWHEFLNSHYIYSSEGTHTEEQGVCLQNDILRW